ncbi:hypothetical protein DBV15_02497, partial [Temnothorax longispinosus]
MKDILSTAVWKRPCPNLELVSMNLRLIFSSADLLKRLRQSSDRCSAQTVASARSPCGVSMYPTRPTTIIGGVSRIVTASTISFLF